MDNFEVFSHFFPFWISICILYDRLETLLQLSLYLICISKLFPFSSLLPSIKLQKQCCSTTAPSVIYYQNQPPFSTFFTPYKGSVGGFNTTSRVPYIAIPLSFDNTRTCAPMVKCIYLKGSRHQ